MMHYSVACIQLNSANRMEENIEEVERLVREAAKEGAKLICLPENAFLMVAQGAEYGSYAFDEVNHIALIAMQHLAKELGCMLLIGSVAVKSETSNKYYNRSLLMNGEGEITARYDKIHLFDAQLPNGENYTESARFEAGNRAVLAETPAGKLGLTICYDVRFPHLHRSLAKAGAEILTVPAAFTYQTGSMHWHTLLRARAIETGCFVLAPAQCGVHPGNRRTYGHSLIIDPFGNILNEGTENEVGIIHARLEMGKVKAAREALPALRHDRNFSLSEG
jgi:predicted amidohydrolase